ncbi:MAG: DHCW motif cupin fold protein [Terriglobia bacterium]|nr:DHCW motif cupin fold protein [Terriglobia bacterium]
MKMPSTEMFVTNWSELEPTRHAGESGFALWRTQNLGDIRIRILEYSPGYRADHWCSKGHVLFCLSGSLEVELKDGRKFSLSPNQSYQVGDGDPPHRSHTSEGATLFVVD